MANRQDGDHHNNDSGDDVNNPVLTRAEFLDFRDENQQFCDSTQQTLDQIQEALVTLLNRNPNRGDEERRDGSRGPPYRGPNRNRQQDYNEEDNEDEEYAERVLGDRKSTRLNSSHRIRSRMPSSA